MLLWAVVLGGFVRAAAEPPAAEPDTSTTEQKYFRVSGKIFNHRFTKVDDDGWGSRLDLKLGTSIHRFETIDEFLEIDIESVQSYLEPKLSLEIPTGIPKLTFAPNAEVLAGWNYASESLEGGASLAATFRYRDPLDPYQRSISLSGKYGTRNVWEAVNSSDYVELSLQAEGLVRLGVDFGEHELSLKPFAKVSYFIDELEVQSPDTTNPLAIREKYELGVEIGTTPRYRLWKLKMRHLRISYVFNRDTHGIQIKF